MTDLQPIRDAIAGLPGYADVEVRVDELSALLAEVDALTATKAAYHRDLVARDTRLLELKQRCQALEAERDALRLQIETLQDGGCVHDAGDGTRLMRRGELEALIRERDCLKAENTRFYEERQEMRKLLYRPAPTLTGTVVAEFDPQPEPLDALRQLRAENAQLRADLSEMEAKRNELFEIATKHGRDLAASEAKWKDAFIAGIDHGMRDDCVQTDEADDEAFNEWMRSLDAGAGKGE